MKNDLTLPLSATPIEQPVLPNKVELTNKNYSALVTYCRHTGIKLVIGTEFQTTRLKAKFLKAEHPIFVLPFNKLLQVVGESFQDCNTTEQYLLIIAFLKSLGSQSNTNNCLFDTSQSPILLNEKAITLLNNSFYYLVKAYRALVTSNKQLPFLPTYRVTREIAQDASSLLTYLKRITNLISHASVLHCDIDLPVKSSNKLDDELELERQLAQILISYDAASKPKQYTSKLGKWTISQLVIVAPDLEDDVIASISYYIQSTDNSLDEVVLKKYISLLEDVMPMGELEREQSLLVIAHLKSKLGDIYRELENYGFTLLTEEEETIGGRDETATSEAIAGIKVKKLITSVTPNQVVSTKVKKSEQLTHGKGDALSRMMAKFGKAKQPTIIKQGTTNGESS